MAETEDKKLKKRKWYEILSNDFNDAILGETVSKEPNLVFNRIIKVNLGSLTREIKLQNISVLFKIKDFKENRFYTEVYGYELNPSYIKRIVRNKKTKIDDSFVCKSKDDIEVRIKPLIITKNNVNNSLSAVIMKTNRELFNNFLIKKEYKEFFRELIEGKVCPEFKKTLSKIYPISFFEIRVMQRLH